MNTATDKVVRYIAGESSPEDTIPDPTDSNYINTPGSLPAFKEWATIGDGSTFEPPTITISSGVDHIEHEVYSMPKTYWMDGREYSYGGDIYLGKVLGTCDLESGFHNAPDDITH